MHYYKLNIADWNLSTAHLNLEEEAIYFRLVNHYYKDEKPIPLETHSVFRRLRMATQEQSALSILGEFFELTDKGWVHSRCEKDLKEYRKTAAKNKRNGASGGRPSKNAASKETQSVSSGLPNESQNNPNHKPITNNHKPVTSNKRFTPPAPQEVVAYMTERCGNSLEAERFTDYYTANGWKVGKNSMKDWKAAVRNWLKNNYGGSNGANKQAPRSTPASRAAEQARIIHAECEAEEASLNTVDANGAIISQQVGEPRGRDDSQRPVFREFPTLVQENG